MLQATTVLRPGQKCQVIFENSTPAQEVTPKQQRQLKPVSTGAGSSCETSFETNPFTPCLVVFPTLLQVQPTRSLPGVGVSQHADTRTPWEFTGVNTKGITCFPAATPPLPLTISSRSWFSGADQQTLLSLQDGCLAAHVFSPSSTWVMLGCIQHLMSAWQDSSVMS